MKSLVVYYSYSGNTAKLAQAVAKQSGADLAEVKDLKRPGTLKAYTAGCLAAMRWKPWPIRPLKADLAAYDKLIIMAPVWANQPAPAIFNVFKTLPSGREVEVILVSASGRSGAKDKVYAAVQRRGSKVASYKDMKG